MASCAGVSRFVILLLWAAALDEVAAQSSCADESCKVDNTARLTWTLLGVLLIINLLLFCMLTCTWYYLFTRTRDLRRQIDFNRTKRGGVVDCHVDTNRNHLHYAGYDHRASVALEYFPNSDNKPVRSNGGVRTPRDYPLDTFHSQDVFRTSQDVRNPKDTHNSQDVRDSKEFDDYSTVVDAVTDSPPPEMDGMIHTIPNPSRISKVSTASKNSKMLMKKSLSQPHSVHPFYCTQTEDSPARKVSKQRKRQRQIHHATSEDTPPTDSQQATSDSADHYSHIVDGFSPVERESTVFSGGIDLPADSISPPAAKKPASASPFSQLQDDSVATQDFVPERDSYVYSTPYPDGVQNLRRLTVSKAKPHSQEELDRDDDQHHLVVRPKSALGLYPLDLSSANSSPCSTLDGRRRNHKKDQQHLRPVSAYYNHSDTSK